jgi:hypothetical protein
MDGDVSFHSKTRVFNQNGRVGNELFEARYDPTFGWCLSRK